MEDFFGLLTMALGIAAYIVGLSAQAVKQYREKRCGISIIFVCLGMATLASRITYLALSGAYWAIPSDVAGIIISTVIIYQYGAYERRWW